MQSKNKFMDDMSQIMTNAMGVAQGAKDEAENAMKSFMDRWLADRNFVTREEFDAVRAMAQKARAQNEDLSARLEALEAAAAKKAPKSKVGAQVVSKAAPQPNTNPVGA
ncbi:accessory factor UbiK family protein [uncultured Planktomarina sp.]|uniref:accessory factor UbiK family protein n=2 Tax=Planktomarina TaxID=1284657 RepID=UPI003260AFD2